MTAKTVGTATTQGSDDTLWELRVFDNAEHVATFLSSSLVQMTSQDRAGNIPYVEGELSVDVALHLPGLIKQGARIELFAGKKEDTGKTADLHRIFIGTIDYITTDTEEGRTIIRFQARGLAAALMDARFKGVLADSLKAAVEGLASPAGLRAETAYAETPLSLWVNAQSSYGVLRLLAANLGAVVRAHDDVIEFMSGKEYLERMQKKPVFKIRASDIQSSHTEQGHPVKRPT